MSTGDARERNSIFTFVYDATGPTLALERTLAPVGGAAVFELGFDEPCWGAYTLCTVVGIKGLCVCVFAFCDHSPCVGSHECDVAAGGSSRLLTAA